MKKNYLIPTIETIVLGYSLMQTTDATSDDGVKDEMDNVFGAPKRRTQPF